MKTPAHRWPLYAGLVALAAIALLAGVFLLAAPLLLDLPVVKSGIERKLSRVADGHIAFETLQIRLLPAPHVEMAGVVFERPGWGEARIEQAHVGLRLLPLLHGRPEFTSISVLRPVVRLDLAPSPPGPSPAQAEVATEPVTAYRSAMGPLARALADAAPGALFEVSDADVTVRGTLAPELRLRDLSLRIRTDASGFNLEGKAGGNLWDRLNLAGRVEFADLSSSVGLDLSGLDAKAWLDDWFAGGWLRMDIPRADVRVRVVTDARTELRCSLGIDAASLRITHAAHGVPVSRSRLEATGALGAHEIEVKLNELQIGSLIPEAHGTLHMNIVGEKPRLEVELPKLDVGAVRDSVTALMRAESPAVRQHAARAVEGNITHLAMRSQGENWNALIRLDHLDGSAVLEHASVRLPVVEREARELNGRIGLSHAAFELADARAQVGSSVLHDGGLRYSIPDGAVSARTGFDLELIQALEIARSALPQDRARALEDVEASGRLQGLASFASSGPDWNVGIDVSRSNASVRAGSLPWPVSLLAAQASISPRQVGLRGVQLTAGTSSFHDLTATLALGAEPRLTSGSGRATLALDEIYPWLRSLPEGGALLGSVDSVSGGLQIVVNSLSGAPSQPAALAFDVTARPQQLRIGVKGWPDTLTLDGGAVHADAATVKVDRVTAAILDAQGLISGEVAGYRESGKRISASFADTVVGEQCTHWIWQRTGAPPRFEPRAPLHLAVERLSFDPGEVVDALGSVTFESGPSASVDLRWAPDMLDVSSVVIRDQDSDARFGLRRLGDDLFEATFSGSIFARSIAAMFKRGGQYHGQANGQLRVMLDLEHPGRTSAHGAITAQDLDLDQLLPNRIGPEARIDRLDLRADGSSLQIQEATVRWARQVAMIRGRIARENRGTIVDVEIVSPGIDVDALLHRAEPPAQEAAGTSAQLSRLRRSELFSQMSDIAVSGQVRLRSEFVEFDGLRLAPLAAVLTLGKERAELRLQEETRLCALSNSMTMQISADGYALSAQIRAQKQQFEEVAQCLTQKRVLITGELDARADLTTNGELDELVTNLAGSVHLETRNGVVRKFALIGNILAMTDISRVFKDRLADLKANGFPYRTLEINGHFSKGRFIVEHLIFDSSAFGLGAEGSIGLAHRDADLHALVAPFTGLTGLLREVPIIGSIPGEVLVIPVAVKGDIRDPDVVPLDPGAVASDLTALFRRALNASVKVLRPADSDPAPQVPRQ